jgi:hypothetical protein
VTAATRRAPEEVFANRLPRFGFSRQMHVLTDRLEAVAVRRRA